MNRFATIMYSSLKLTMKVLKSNALLIPIFFFLYGFHPSEAFSIVGSPLGKPLTKNANPRTASRNRSHSSPANLHMTPGPWDSSAVIMLSSEAFAFLDKVNLSMDSESAEALAGPLFGTSLFPYLAFLYFLSRSENETPKGVIVGFSFLLVFVFLSIPAAIAAKLLYGVSLSDSDWLHGSAESLLTATNLITVIAFRQALAAKEKGVPLPPSATSYGPSIRLSAGLLALATATLLAPALNEPQVHTPYLGAFLDLPFTLEGLGAHSEPENALTIACWIIHISSLVEFLVAMGFAWRWGDVVGNPRWKGLTWGLLPLHSSGITACTYHIFYNQIPLLVPLQALLTCVGNATAAYAAYRIARFNGWKPNLPILAGRMDTVDNLQDAKPVGFAKNPGTFIGLEDLGEALATDNDYSFLVKLFVGCAIASYVIKYGETFFSFPYEADIFFGLTFIIVPSMLNAYKWYQRSRDPKFEGWF